MKRARRILSTVLAGTMIISSLSMTSFAAAQKIRWEQEDGKWYCYDSNNDLYENTIVTDKTGSYYIGGDGAMVTKSFVEDLDTGHIHYASSSGNLSGERWVYLEKGQDGFEEGWYFFKDQYGNDGIGEMVINDFSSDKKYYLTESGRMASNKEIVFEHDENTDEDDECIFAYKDGHLAGSNGEPEWVRITPQGHLTHDEDGGEWHYFKTNRMAAKNEVIKEINDNGSIRIYECDVNGVMYRDCWNKDGEFFYRTSGERAVDTWLYVPYDYIFDDAPDRLSGWYKFDADGHAVYYDDIKASDTDATDKHQRIEEISLSEVPDEYQMTVSAGDTVTIEYDLKLSSSSNAETNKFSKKHHNIWVYRSYGHEFEESFVKNSSVRIGQLTRTGDETGTLTVTYKNPLPGVIDFFVKIDGIVSETISIITEKVETDAKTEVATILDSTAAGYETETVNALKEAAKDSEAKNAIAESYSDSEQLKTIKNLESSYTMATGVTVNEPAVSDEASEVLSDGSVSIVGAGLNMSEPGEVQLNVGIGEDKELDKEYTNQASLDLTLVVDNDSNNTLSELDVPVQVTVPLPKTFSSNEDVSVYHFHDGESYEVIEGTVEGNSVSFVVDQFSTFVLVQGAKSGDSGDSDSTPYPSDDDYEPEYISVTTKKEPEESGAWIEDAFGWWYKNPDGTYPANKWEKLAYNGKTFWYRFNEQGYMMTGWFTAADGNIYYLNPVSDGFKGAMVTGWQQIGDFWYYFNPEPGAIEGALFVNTTTPDNYKVNELGQWVQ